MKRIIYFILFSLFLSGCAQNTEKLQLKTSVQGRDYNSVGKLYLPVLTTSEIARDPSGKQADQLWYLFDLYGNNKFALIITKNTASKNIDAIDKYLEWESIALKDSDIITKEISIVSPDAPLIQVNYKYGITSGDEKNHYLYISQCSGGLVDVCVHDIYLDRENAIKLKNEINKFTYNQISIPDYGKYK